MSLTEEQLAEIRARAEAATPPPWQFTWDEDGNAVVCQPLEVPAQGHLVAECSRCKAHPDARGYDAAFIAAARTDVPALLAEVDRLRQLYAGRDASPQFEGTPEQVAELVDKLGEPPGPATAVSITDLIGIDPNFTGGLSKMRGGMTSLEKACQCMEHLGKVLHAEPMVQAAHG